MRAATPFDPARFEARSNEQDLRAGNGHYEARTGEVSVDGAPPYKAVRRQPQHPKVGGISVTPVSFFQALMEAPPGQEPGVSLEDREAVDEHRDVLYERLNAAIQDLPERERYVLSAIYSEGVSLRALGARLSLSKTHVSRLRDSALAKLRDALTTTGEGE